MVFIAFSHLRASCLIKILDSRITVEDIQILRAFQFKHNHFLSLNAFKSLPSVFPEICIPSFDRIQTQIHFLSGLEAALYDCCINSCCCFVGGYENDSLVTSRSIAPFEVRENEILNGPIAQRTPGAF